MCSINVCVCGGRYAPSLSLGNLRRLPGALPAVRLRQSVLLRLPAGRRAGGAEQRHGGLLRRLQDVSGV